MSISPLGLSPTSKAWPSPWATPNWPTSWPRESFSSVGPCPTRKKETWPIGSWTTTCPPRWWRKPSATAPRSKISTTSATSKGWCKIGPARGSGPWRPWKPMSRLGTRTITATEKSWRPWAWATSPTVRQIWKKSIPGLMTWAFQRKWSWRPVAGLF